MAIVIQLRRGTTAENDLFTGALAEPTYDTDQKELRVHDGSTVGGKVVSVPTGALMGFAGSTAPSGWLVCDGSAVSRTTYADLFARIGSTYGDGDGSTTFNLPDCDGYLPIYDSGATLGDTTDGKAPNITGYFYRNAWTRGGGGYANSVSGAFTASNNSNGRLDGGDGSSNSYGRVNLNASNSSAVYDSAATKITPAGVYTLWCIKY